MTCASSYCVHLSVCLLSSSYVPLPYHAYDERIITLHGFCDLEAADDLVKGEEVVPVPCGVARGGKLEGCKACMVIEITKVCACVRACIRACVCVCVCLRVSVRVCTERDCKGLEFEMGRLSWQSR